MRVFIDGALEVGQHGGRCDRPREAGLSSIQLIAIMPTYYRFEDLPVWQEAARLYNIVLDLLEQHARAFSYAFQNQLDRAALSVSNNIAEGFERATTKELLNFIAIARGSAGEVRSMMTVVIHRENLKPLTENLSHIRTIAESCGRQLTSWSRSIDSSPIQGKRYRTNTN